jgi:hypothetical protein
VGDRAGKALARFAAEVVAGEVDYFLRVVVSDAAAFDAFFL